VHNDILAVAAVSPCPSSLAARGTRIPGNPIAAGRRRLPSVAGGADVDGERSDLADRAASLESDRIRPPGGIQPGTVARDRRRVLAGIPTASGRGRIAPFAAVTAIDDDPA
jgi:hypothetical protein